MGRKKGDVDELIRVRISEIAGYGKKLVSTEDFFFKLFKIKDSYNDRAKYNQVMAIIHKDRKDFCDGVWDEVRKMLVNPTYEDYRRAYKYCVDTWYLQHRTLLYPYPNGWGTPMRFEELEAFEYVIAQQLAASIINKDKLLRNVALDLPYSKEIQQLEMKAKQLPNLQWIPFFKGLTRVFRKIRKIIQLVEDIKEMIQ